MRLLSRPTFLAVCTLLAASCRAWGQGAPAPSRPSLYRGLQLPSLGGTLRYSVSANETATLNYDANSQTAYNTGLSGNLAYLSVNPAKQFSLIYSGGYLKNTSGQPSTFFQNLSLGQTLRVRRWFLTVTDNLSYLPQAPSTGLSGIPGLGDLGVLPPVPYTGALTPYSQRLDNALGGTVSRQLTGSTSLSGTGSYSIQRFISGQGGLEADSLSAGGGISHRIDARTSTSAQYTYSQSTFVGYPLRFASQGVSFGFRRQVTRRVSASLAAGPERTSSSTLLGIGPSLNYTANANLTYTGDPVHGASFSGAYTHDTNSGSGVTFGARTDTLSATATRALTHEISGSAQVSYNRTTSLQTLAADSLNSHAETASVQVNRALTRSLSAYASGTALWQAASGAVQGLAPLNGRTQTIGFGVTYSPASLHLGHL